MLEKEKRRKQLKKEGTRQESLMKETSTTLKAKSLSLEIMSAALQLTENNRKSLKKLEECFAVYEMLP